MLDRAGKEKQNGGKAGETKCRRADWVVWLERVSPLSMIWVRRTHDYQRRAAESGSSGVQCSPIQLWVRGKEAGTFIKRKQKKARRGRQPFEKSVVRVGWLNNQNEHEHMHQKASHWSQSAGYGFRERHKSDVCCNIRKKRNKKKPRGAGASQLRMRGWPRAWVGPFLEGHTILFPGMWSTKQQLIQSQPEQRQEGADTKQTEGHS